MSIQDLSALALIALIVFAFFTDWGLNHSGESDSTRTKEDRHG